LALDIDKRTIFVVSFNSVTYDMKFAGLQKLTLLDYPEHMACTLFLRGCNFKCPFCHNAVLLSGDTSDDEITEDEVFAFLEKRKKVLDGVAITGGEPTLYSALPDFIRRVKAMGLKVKLDTNGTNPDMLRSLLEERLLDYVAMDVKSAPEEYNILSGVDADMEKITRSRDLLLSGTIDYEFRTTVVKGLHTEKSILGAAKWIMGAKAYYLQKYTDSGEVLSPTGLEAYSNEEMRHFSDIAKQFVTNTQCRGV